MNIQFNYIDENLKRILENPDSVMYISPFDVGKKKALFAVVKEDEGVYKKVQLTKEESKLTFPFEPLYWFYNGPGYTLLDNFISFHNNIAVNITNLDGFKYKTFDDEEIKNFSKKTRIINKIAGVNIFATFSDGSATFVTRDSSKHFEKNGNINAYIDMLKAHKEYNPKHETYKCIEAYSVDNDTFIIPELQKKEEQPKVKKKTIV